MQAADAPHWLVGAGESLRRRMEALRPGWHRDGGGMPTLRQLMLRLVVFTQLPAYLAIGGLLALHYEEERTRVSSELAAHAHALAFALDERMLRVQRQLEGLAPRVPQSPAALPAFRNEALLVQALAGADSIVLATPDGRPLLDTGVAPDAASSVRLPEPMLATLRAGAPVYSRLDAGEHAEWPQAAVAVAVMRAHRLDYALVAGLERRRFQPLLTGQGLPEGWIASIIDDHGIMVARVPNPEALVGLSASPRLQEAIARQDRGVLESRTLDGVAVITAYSHSPVHGWTAIVAVPRSLLYAPLWRSAAYQALTAAVLLTLTMVLSLRTSRRFVHSMDRLDVESEFAAAGHPVQPQGMGFAEARRIGERLRSTGDAMRDARVRLSDSEQQLHAILQTATDAIIVSDSEARVVLLNEAAQRLFGTTPDALHSDSLEQLMAPATWPQYLDLCRRHRLGERIPLEDLVTVRGQGRRADGTLFPMEYSLSHFVDAAGAGFCTIVVRDITRRLQYEASLIAARSELRRMNSEFQQALFRETGLRQAAVARELHDSVGSSLAGVSLLLGTARSFATEPEAAVLIARAQEEVMLTTRQVRQISRGMMPAGQDRGALVPALQHFASQTCELPGVSCRFCSHGDFDQVPAEVAGHLYRIVQEACNNALRHGAASHLHIMLARVGDRCRLTIRDNGSGCDPAVLSAPQPGIGMKSMRARTDAIGGHLHLSQRPGGGLTIQVAWSARNSEQPEPWAALVRGA